MKNNIFLHDILVASFTLIVIGIVIFCFSGCSEISQKSKEEIRAHQCAWLSEEARPSDCTEDEINNRPKNTTPLTRREF